MYSMKDGAMIILSPNNEKGFTLIEIAIVMVIIGLLAGGGVSLMGVLSERRVRNETSVYLDDAKNALISFTRINGRLPWADNDNDGYENPDTPGPGETVGTFPYLTLGFRPLDSNKRVLKYELNSSLMTDLSTSCSSLRTGLGGSPLAIDSDGAPNQFSVAAILISAGQKDADGDGNVFDNITTGPYQGDNRDGIPRYIRHPPIDVFDDLVVYISGYELYGEICGNSVVTIKNDGGSVSNVYVYNSTLGSNIGIVPAGNAISYKIVSGEQIELCSGPGACSMSPVTSSPMTPLTVSGSGVAIDVP